MDQKLIDYALQNKLIDDISELETLSELDKEALEGAYDTYEYVHGRMKVQQQRVTINEKGERVFGETYW